MRRARSAQCLRSLACLLVMLPLAAAAATPALQFARQTTGGPAIMWTLVAQRPVDRANATVVPSTLQTPLGSVWKLFVYTYLVDRHLASPDYHCGDDPPGLTPASLRHRRDDEVYCCHAGEQIGRDKALVQSCGLYFEPQRLGLDAGAWRDYWRKRQAPAWLQELSSMTSTQQVQVRDLLAALDAVPESARMQAGNTLISVVTLGYGKGTVGDYGSMLRAKTWTMPDPQHTGASIGGAAGWLADGTPVWLSGAGSSRRVLADAAPLLRPLMAAVPVPDNAACVIVDYFERYPIRRVLPAQGQAVVRDGTLDGRFRVNFANGNWADVQSGGELSLHRAADGTPRLRGRLGLNDYIARVLDREGDAREPAATQALAVAARSYLMQQGTLERGCWRIADSSRTQRVAPRPPSDAARLAASWTDTLVLADVSVQYHQSQAAPAQMGWQQAVQLSRQGLPFDAILARSWPGATLTSFLSPLGGDCRPLTAAQTFIDEQAPRWARQLVLEPGYETPANPAVCQLREGRPYADARRNRLYVHGLANEEDRIALAHEYLHLAFAHHPRGQDETFIERRARALLRTVGANGSTHQGLPP